MNKSTNKEYPGEKCKLCDQEETALGGDVHCQGDCDDFSHNQKDGCHRYVDNGGQNE